MIRTLYLAATNNAEIAADLLEFFKAYLADHPEAQAAPIYIVCESYGGKMGIEFARSLQAAALPIDFR